MKIEYAINFNCTPDNIFPWIDDPNKAMCWQKGVKDYQIIESTADKIGTSFKEEMEENGKSLIIEGKITQYYKDRLISFQLESTIHKLDVNYTIERKGNQSIVRLSSYIVWKFPINIMLLLIGRKIKNNILQQTKEEFEELKRLCGENYDNLFIE